MKIKEIYLDLDDVLNSFAMNILSKFEVAHGPYSYYQYPVEVGYDIVKAYNTLKSGEPVEDSYFWNSILEEDWAKAPKSFECDALVNKAIELVGVNNVYIATSPTLCPYSCSGKLKWIQTCLPFELQRQFFITPRKEQLGSPGRLLIDDNVAHCSRFNKMGGTSILMPRPWNSVSSINSWLDVEDYVLDVMEISCEAV